MARALTCPAEGMPTIIPNCCCTDGSDAVASMRPNSIGVPRYFSKSGRMVEAITVVVGNVTGVVPRTAPTVLSMGALVRDKQAAHAIEGTHTGNVAFDYFFAGRSARRDGLMEILDRGLFQTKGIWSGVERCCHWL